MTVRHEIVTGMNLEGPNRRLTAVEGLTSIFCYFMGKTCPATVQSIESVGAWYWWIIGSSGPGGPGRLEMIYDSGRSAARDEASRDKGRRWLDGNFMFSSWIEYLFWFKYIVTLQLWVFLFARNGLQLFDEHLQ